MSYLIRAGGVLIVTVAVLLLARAPEIASWLGRPVGWRVLWESFRGKGPVGSAIYEGYTIYTTIAGWFWFLFLEAFILGIGIHLTAAGKW